MPFYDIIIVGAGPAGLAAASMEHQKDYTHCWLKEKLQEDKRV
jgi:thioredoxin reductase